MVAYSAAMGDAEMSVFGVASSYLRKSDRDRMEASTRPFDMKKECFIPDPVEEFVMASVISRDGDKATVETKNGKVRRGLLLMGLVLASSTTGGKQIDALLLILNIFLEVSIMTLGKS